MTQCAFKAIKSNRFSFSPLGMEHRERVFWRVMKFWWFCHTHVALLTRSMPPGVSSDQSSSGPLTSSTQHLVQDLLSGLWPNWSCASQLVLALQWHIPLFLCYGHLITTTGSQPSALWVVPRVVPSRMDHTASAHLLWHYPVPSGYSNWKLNLTRAPTHQ